MQKSALTVLLVLLCLVLGVAPALAQDDEEFDDEAGGSDIDRTRSGMYLSVRGLYGIDFFNLNGVRTLAREGVTPGAGIDTRVGYRITPIFAVEGQFEWHKDYTLTGNVIRGPFGIPVRPQSVWEAIGGSLNGKAYLPLGPFHPYLLAGVGLLHNTQRGPGDIRVHDTGAAFRGGVGADLYGFGSDQWALTAEVDYVAGVGDVEYFHAVVVSGGFTWRW